MKMYWTLVCCLVCVALSAGRAEDYHPERTLLMDHYPSTKPTNFLFRGNMPVVNGQFAYDQIVSSMKSAIADKNFTFPSNYSLVDISYLNIFEEKDLRVEEQFFSANPSLGVLYKKPIVGTIIKPPQNETTIMEDLPKLYEALSIDKLPELMQFFRDLVTGPGPVLIYSHCEAGTDRTGEVSGAYYLKFLNMTFTEALYIDNHIQHRDMYTVSRNALQWYCFYLKYVENKSHLKCIV